MNFRPGNFCSLPEKMRSVVLHIRLVAYSANETAIGASSWGAPAFSVTEPRTPPLVLSAEAEAEKPGTKLPEPKCRLTGMSVSSKTAHSGSQWSLWNDGNPSGSGLSGKETVRAPFE